MMVQVVGGLQADIGEDGSNMGKNFARIAFMVMLIGFGGTFGCTNLSSPPPHRDFSTSDLLISPSQVPKDWKAVSEYRDEPASVLGYRDVLGGSSIEFDSPTTSVDHIVTAFPTANDAKLAYKDHDYTRDKGGLFPETWYEIPEWNYTSPIADQYRVYCVQYENTPKLGDLCVIEAQYEEFLSNLIYSNNASDRTVSDLILLAKAIDERMVEFLEK
jgi:hypothetical protein